jgi:hypothetical protein
LKVYLLNSQMLRHCFQFNRKNLLPRGVAILKPKKDDHLAYSIAPFNKRTCLPKSAV